jgi:hypothetical protein
MADKAIADHPKDALVPKFYLLNAYNAGKTAGKEIMILQLEQIVLNYGNTPEGKKAKDLLKFLKSDAKLEFTDENGNAMSQKDNPSTTNAEEEERQKEQLNSSAPIGGPGIPGSVEMPQQTGVKTATPEQAKKKEIKKRAISIALFCFMLYLTEL